MHVHLVRHRPQQANFVHDAGKARQMLAKVNAGHFGPRWREFTTYFNGSSRLQVPQINLARPAKEEQEHTRLGSRWRSAVRKPRTNQSERAQAAKAQQLAPRRVMQQWSEWRSKHASLRGNA